MDEANEIELFRRLEAISPHLAERIKRLGQIVEDPLTRIYSIFPAYTDHSKSHSEQVMTILGWLVPVEMTNPLSAQEMFYLLAAALLHDIGMLEAVEKVGDREAQEQIRESHHLRSEQYVRENYERLGLDKPEANAIGEICRSHRKTNIAEDVRDVSSPQGTLVRMQLLCAALRIADELHLTADRAPKMVLDAIRPPQDSVSHFEKHLSIDGVGPLGSSEGVIQINATAQTFAQERALRQMTEEIREKLTEVAPIFARHGLPWEKIELELQRRKVVERKVILFLARFGESYRKELATNLNEAQGAIEICLQDLTQWHCIQSKSGEEAGQVDLVADAYTFGHLLREFLKSEEELEFVTSPYLRKCIEEFAFDGFCQRFDAAYDLQEKEDRILVLQSSPTALYLLLFASEFQVEPAIIPRRAVLDGAILFGFLTDLFRFPEIAQIRGVASAIIAIQDKMRRESGHLLRLFSALGPDLGRDPEDVFKDLIPPLDLKNIGPEDGISFQLTVSHPKNALKRGLTFPHLLKAAFRSGEQLEFVANRVVLSSEDLIPKEAADPSLNYVVITPQPSPPKSGIIFCRVEIDHSRKRITLFVDGQRSTDYIKYPLAVRTTISQGRSNTTFRPSVYIPNLNVQQALEIDTMLQWMKSGEFNRLVVQIDQPEPRHPEVSPVVMETLGSELKDVTVEPLFDNAAREVLRCLSQLQGKIDERIPCPIRLTTQQEEAIVELAKASDEMSPSKIRDELLSIAEQAKLDWTTVRISTYFPNGQIKTDQFLGPFPRIVPQIEFKTAEKNQKVAEQLQEGSAVIQITQNFTFDAETLGQRIAEGFSGSRERTLLPQEAESNLAANAACQVTFQFIQDKTWYREQVVHYQIRDISIASDIFSNASRLLKQNQITDAIGELIEGLKRFPQDSFLSGLLGWAYYKAGDLDSAYQYSLKAINLQQEMWSVRVDFAYYNLGLCCLQLDRFEEGISWYNKAVTSGPGTTLDEAIEDLEAIITPKMPEVLYALAFLYEQKDVPDRAVELYRQFIDSDSQHSEYKELARGAIQRIEQSG